MEEVFQFKILKKFFVSLHVIYFLKHPVNQIKKNLVNLLLKYLVNLVFHFTLIKFIFLSLI